MANESSGSLDLTPPSSTPPVETQSVQSGGTGRFGLTFTVRDKDGKIIQQQTAELKL